MKKSTLRFSSVLLVVLTSLSMASCTKEMDLKEPGALVPKTVDEDHSLPSISVNGTMLHSETFGNPDSPMVVVMHGGPGCDYRSVLNCSELANDGYYVVFFDQRGSGLSRREPKDSYTINVMLEDLQGVIDHYRTSASQKIFFFGHSWGAILATGYINQHPGAISGAVLLEPGGFTFDDVKEFVKRMTDVSLFAESTNDIFYPDQIITGDENDHEAKDYKRILTAATTYALVGDVKMCPFWRYGAVVSEALFDLGEETGFDWKANLNQYTTKVLFMYSEHNKAYGHDWAQKVSSAYSNVQLEEIKGSGHEMVNFAWSQVHPLALNYFNSLK
jgi:proline iminopeptidase